LTDDAMEILREMAEVRVDDQVFPGGKRGRPVADTTLRELLAKLSPGATVHGFRSTFRDWCADTGKPAEVAEAALAHAPPGRVIQAYQRSDLLEQRRSLMDAWARFLLPPESMVVPFGAAA
jgi:integrase